MLVKKAPISAPRLGRKPSDLNSYIQTLEQSPDLCRLEGRRRRSSRLESFLRSVSATFARISSEQVGDAVGVWIDRLARLLRVDCISLWEWSEQEPAFRSRFVFPTWGVEFPAPGFTTRSYPWLTQEYRGGRVVAWSRIPEDIPAEAIAERARALEVGAKSALGIPMQSGKQVYVIAFTSCRHQRAWSRPTIRRLRLIGELFVEALRHEQGDRTVHAPKLPSARYLAKHGRITRRTLAREQMFRTVFESSATGLALVAPDGRWLEVNQSINRILGYTSQELRNLDIQALTHAEDLPAELACMRRALAGEIDRYQLEKRYINKKGRPVMAALTVSLIRARNGRPLYFICELTDITERKQAQLQIAGLRAQLTHAGRVSLTSRLTASLAHQLLQPVTAILGNVEAGQHALRASTMPNAAALEAILVDIGTCGKAAAEVIERVRGLLRSQPQPLEPVDFDQVVGDVLKVVHSHLIMHQVRLITRLHGATHMVVGDRVQLQQLVLNLIMNAVDAMYETEVAERVLVVSSSAGMRELELTVCDQGVGIDPTYLQRMFDPFFTTKPGGMGMGLYLSAEIVHSHGGKIWAERNEGPGLTLHCRLPAYVRSDAE
jgi:PAS domain S-box-containing protein